MAPRQPPLCSRTFCAALILTAGVLNVPAMYFLSLKALSLYSQFTGPDIAAQQEAARANFLQNCTSFSQHGGSDCNFKCTAVPASAASMYTCQWCATPPDGSGLPPPWEQNACVGTMGVNNSDPLPLVSDPSQCTTEQCNGSCSNCQYGAGDPSLVLLACAVAVYAMFPLHADQDCCNKQNGGNAAVDSSPYSSFRPWNRNCCQSLPAVAAPTRGELCTSVVCSGIAIAVMVGLFAAGCATGVAVHRGTVWCVCAPGPRALARRPSTALYSPAQSHTHTTATPLHNATPQPQGLPLLLHVAPVWARARRGGGG